MVKDCLGTRRLDGQARKQVDHWMRAGEEEDGEDRSSSQVVITWSTAGICTCKLTPTGFC